jgi:integration host factor subunit alpha
VITETIHGSGKKCIWITGKSTGRILGIRRKVIMVLTKGKIVENVYTALGISKKESATLVESFFEIIKDELSNGNDVMISGFGKWTVKSKNQRKIRDFRTGEENILAARKIVKFKPSGKLRDTVNKEAD